MKEITVTYTLEVTEIYKDVPDGAPIRIPEDRQKRMERLCKEDLGADDVHVRDLKLFIRDE